MRLLLSFLLLCLITREIPAPDVAEGYEESFDFVFSKYAYACSRQNKVLPKVRVTRLDSLLNHILDLCICDLATL